MTDLDMDILMVMTELEWVEHEFYVQLNFA